MFLNLPSIIMYTLSMNRFTDPRYTYTFVVMIWIHHVEIQGPITEFRVIVLPSKPPPPPPPPLEYMSGPHAYSHFLGKGGYFWP